MTAKDFRLIAEILASFEGRSSIASPELVATFSDAFATNFPGFQSERFERAAAPIESERMVKS
jgi:hypothetical protein